MTEKQDTAVEKLTERRDTAAEEFIDDGLDTAGQAESVGRLDEEMFKAAAASPWGRAFIRMRAQQILAQYHGHEINMALTSRDRKAKYVPTLRDSDLWRRIESRLNRDATNVADDLLDTWRVEEASYEAGGRDTPPPWPRIGEETG